MQTLVVIIVKSSFTGFFDQGNCKIMRRDKKMYFNNRNLHCRHFNVAILRPNSCKMACFGHMKQVLEPAI